MCFLDTSIKIQTIELKNRLAIPPIAISKADENGKATSRTFDYYTEKSAGGYISLIIAEHTYVSPEGKASKGQLSISEDNDIGRLKKLVSLVYKDDTKIMAQINHVGGTATPDITGLGQLSAGAVKISKGSLMIPEGNLTIPLPREVNPVDIKEVINDFTEAVLRAKAAGFDGVETHSIHGYLLNQFYSPSTNKRIGEYTGDTIRGRVGLHLEIVQAIREAVGKNYPVAPRLGVCDYTTGGSIIEDSVLAAQEFIKAGIDLIDISNGLCDYINPTSHKWRCFDGLSKAIKDTVSVPVILAGGITGAEAAEMLLEQKKADLIGVGRAILKDSRRAKKAMKP